ncbi:MAG: serine acetyltransferase [Spirochaetaceae bacterium]|jgi:serine O-acetyltransferase|nr:serine acetyltransferase [Spirochaetaceae bacterium]
MGSKPNDSPDDTRGIGAAALLRADMPSKHGISGSLHIREIVDMLLKSYEEIEETIKIDSVYQLNRSLLIEIIEKLRRLIFPGYFVRKFVTKSFVEYQTGSLVEEIFFDLTKQIAISLCHRKDGSPCHDAALEKAEELVRTFLSKLPEIREYLAMDVDAAFDGDPAAYSKDEIISSYPGVYAIMVYRLAHELYLLDIPLIPRIMTEYAHNITGIDIHPGATIGRHFFIDHGTGIVIGETTVIGNNVKVYQGVTLGGLSTRGGQTLRGIKRHPTIEDDVTIYSGASILGGNTVIGRGVVIGSNAFVTKSVPEMTRVSVKNPELQIHTSESKTPDYSELDQNEFWDWVI